MFKHLDKEIHVVIDGQFGSTGKGLLAGYLAEELQPDTVCTAWAANAGHTYIDGNGRKFVHTMLANAIVSPKLKRIMIGAGSIIDPDNLQREFEAAADLLQNVNIFIHPQAAIISQAHRDTENVTMVSIGSTKKGVGEAAIQRIRRDLINPNTAALCDHPFIANFVTTVQIYQKELDDAQVILVEGAQGYSLSMYHGFYPYTTSRDVSTHQVLADCCIPFHFCPVTTYGCFRTWPIRVANRFNDQGDMVGWSGPHYPDQHEAQWSELGIEPELTTVTKLPRRIFTFSMQQYIEAVNMCGIDVVFLNFANYLTTPDAVYHFARRLNQATHAQVKYIGIGPTKNDVKMVDGLGYGGMERLFKETLGDFKTSLGEVVTK